MDNSPAVTKTDCEQVPEAQARKPYVRIVRYVVFGIATLALLVYVGICIWVYVNQRELLYSPQSTHVEAQTTDFSVTHDGVLLRGWVIHPSMPNPIVYFGGNGERIEENRTDFAQWFPNHSVYLLAYRGYGASDGTPSEEALFSDAVSEFDQIQALHPNQPISLIGRSLGSGVAAYLASQRPVAKLVLVTPYDSIARVAQSAFPWLPVRWLIKDSYPSTNYVAGYSRPVLVVRAGNDEVIPAEDTTRLIQAFPHTPVVINIPGRGHNNILKAPAYGQAMSEFLR
jgi:uncharacterized protein